MKTKFPFNFRHFLMFILGVLLNPTIYSQIAKTQVVQLEVKIISDQINLFWPAESYTGTFDIYSRNFGETNYTKVISLSGNTNKYTEKLGITNKEYLVAKVKSGSTEALGYIYAGNKYQPTWKKGGVILLIDSSYQAALKTEIQTLQTDLKNSGWNTYKIYAGRSEKVTAIKSKIQKLMDATTPRPKTLYIIGHVPVPYSGYFSTNGDRPPPDGHVEGSGNHTGAWPADCYYGDFEGIWSDNSVNCTTGSSSRHHNVPKDGKFDQSISPGTIELEIGRLDLFDMGAFSSNDTQLTKEYLDRVHQFRLGELLFEKRALIDNNFTGLNLASTGYHNLPCLVGIDSVSDSKDYFTEQNMGSYLWSYGCGAGSYTTCSGVGSTSNFASYKETFKNAFTILAGSYFGDYDSKNNLLKAALCAGSFNVCWGGIPKWYLHHMGLGLNIGYGAKLTVNNDAEYFNGQFNGSWRGVFIELLGDPTLTMNHVKPVKNLTATSSNGNVILTWNKSSNADSYNVYRIDTATNEITLARSNCNTSSNTSDTFFTDDCNWSTGNYMYAVSAVKLETTGSGTYYNQSMLERTSVQHTNSIEKILNTSITLSPNPISQSFKLTGLIPNTKVQLKLMSYNGQIIEDFEGQMSDNQGEARVNNQNKYNGAAFLMVEQLNERTSIPVVLNNKN